MIIIKYITININKIMYLSIVTYILIYCFCILTYNNMINLLKNDMNPAQI